MRCLCLDTELLGLNYGLLWDQAAWATWLSEYGGLGSHNRSRMTHLLQDVAMSEALLELDCRFHKFHTFLESQVAQSYRHCTIP